MSEPSASKRNWCLVTGASRGIGRAICERLMAEGFNVVCWSRTEASPPMTPLREGSSAQALHQAVDVSDELSVQAAYRDLAAQGIDLSAVVINAGIGHWTSMRELDTAEWRRTMDVNLDGSFFVLRGALQAFGTAKNPLVLGLLSDSALYSFANRSAYSASKAGLRSMLESVRREERARGIRFTLIYPSRVDTHFAGSHQEGHPGLRPDGLQPSSVADVVSYVMAQPPSVEIREVHLAAVSDTFGPYAERSADSE